MFDLPLEAADALLTLQFKGLPPHPARAHWSRVQQAKKRWSQDAWGQLAEQRVGLARVRADEHVRRRVVIHFHRPGPVSDKDNAYALAKVPLDILTRAHGRKKVGLGILWDDAPKWCDLEVETFTGSPTRTTIMVFATPRIGASIDG